MENNKPNMTLHPGRYKLEFNDPYSEETRRLKKSLLIICVITIAISTFNLQFSSYEGFSAQLPVGDDGTKLLASFFLMISTYLAVSFSFHALIDYLAWNAESERLELVSFDMYLDRINIFNNTVNTLLKGALSKTIPTGLEDFISEFDKLRDIAESGNSNEVAEKFTYSLTELLPLLRQQATDIINRQQVIKDNIQHLLHNHEMACEANFNTIKYISDISANLKRLRPRILLKRIYFYFIDALVPVALYCFAFNKAFEGVPVLMGMLFGFQKV